MKLFLIALLLILFWGCSSSAVSSALQTADSVVIHFQPGESAGAKTVSTTEQTAIKKLVQYLNGKAAGNTKCNYDGQVIFYDNSTRLHAVDFNYTNTTCKHFGLLLDGEPVYIRMTDEGVHFFAALRSGKAHY